MQTRIGIGILTAVALLILAPPAAACDEPSIASSSASGGVGPGESIGWSIADMDPGATYSVMFDGSPVAGGTAPDGGSAGGSFKMPDFGSSPRTVELRSEVNHEGGTWPSTTWVQYVPPPAPAPAPSDSAKQNGGAEVPGGSGPGGADQKRSRGGGSGPPDSPAPRVPQSPRGAGLSVSTPGAGATSVGSAGAPSDAAAQTSVEQATEISVPDRVLNAVSGQIERSAADRPDLLLMVLGLVAGLVLGGLAVAIWMLRRGADPGVVAAAPFPQGPDPIEAELQEIIAEATARDLLDPRRSARSGRGDAAAVR